MMIIFNIILSLAIIGQYVHIFRRDKKLKIVAKKTASDINTLHKNSKVIYSVVKDLNQRLLRYEKGQKNKAAVIRPRGTV